MEKNSQNELFLQTLKNLKQVNVLSELVLVGSWCLPIYKSIYGEIPSIPMLRTSDLDLLITNPKNIRKPTDVDKVLCDMGFIRSFDISSPLIKYKNNLLDVEFLSARTRGNEKILNIPELKITAQVLSYMEIAVKYVVEVDYENLKLKIPELPAYTLHKAIVQTQRKNKAKKEKDAATVVGLGCFIEGCPKLRNRTIQIFNEMPKSWQKIILKMVKEYSLELEKILYRQVT